MLVLAGKENNAINVKRADVLMPCLFELGLMAHGPYSKKSTTKLVRCLAAIFARCDLSPNGGKRK